MANARSFLYFVLFVVGITLMLTGGLAWFVTAEQDYSITFDRVEDGTPAGVQGQSLDVGTYEMLDEEQKEDFQRAVDGKVVEYETEEKVWPEAMEKDGRYYIFTTGSHFDWLDPMTFGPALASLVGLLTVVQSARWEHRTY